MFGLLDEKHPLHVRQAAVWLIRSFGKWDRIVMLLETLPLAPEFNDVIRKEVKRWLTMYNRSFVDPTRQHLASVKKLSADCAPMLSPQIVRELQQIAVSQPDRS